MSTSLPRATALHAETHPVAVRTQLLKAEHFGQEARGARQVALPEPGRMQATNLVFGRHRAAGPGRGYAWVIGLDQRQVQAVRVGEWQNLLPEAHFGCPCRHARGRQPVGPIGQAAAGNGERHFRRHAHALAPRRHLRPGEESQVGAGVALGVGIEEVVGAGIVLVDTFLHQAQAQARRVKVEVLLGGAPVIAVMWWMPWTVFFVALSIALSTP